MNKRFKKKDKISKKSINTRKKCDIIKIKK